MEIVILLYKGFTTLDAIGAYEVLCRLPNASVKFAAKEKGVIESEYTTTKMIATHSLDEIGEADILLIPGSTMTFTSVASDEEVLGHIRRIHTTTQLTVSVCSGSVILAAAGLLNGLSATSHWAILDILKKYGAKPVSERYVRQGKIITAAGVSAGLDMALYITSVLEDEDYAKMIQLVLEYYPEPPVDLEDLSAVPKEIEESAISYLRNEIINMGGKLQAVAEVA
ncbi:MAG TPA: DJ-1/PfpI family protein [Flavisolibacter sp.]|nr:DJ-1/PfpI family protein [Flavisolibacter sp.]